MTDPGGGPPLIPRPPAWSAITLSRIMTLLDTNLHGNVHGGVIIRYADDVAGTVASRHSGGRAVTAVMDEFSFHVPVHVGDLVHASGRVTWAGRTSMEVAVEVTAEPWDVAGTEPRHVATAYLVFVAVDDAGRPRPVPPLATGPADAPTVAAAEFRRQARLARRAGSAAPPAAPGGAR